MDFPALFTKALALFTLLGNIASLLLLFAFFLFPKFYRRCMSFFSRHVIALGLFLSASSTIGSIIYSEEVGFPACILCWIQRIFMYPQMFLFGLAIWRRETTIAPYALLLAMLGGAVALYQWVKDMLALYSSVTIPCPAVTALPSCDKIYVLEYGYVTIPMIALNAFILIAIVTYSRLRNTAHA